MRVANGSGKFVIVDGMKPVVGPVGSLEELEKAASEIKDKKQKEEALVSIDIFKTAKKQENKA